jgi:hypothetical protein
MKTALSILLVLIGIAAKTQQNPAEALAQKIANRLKDSLQLTEVQKTQLYTVNMQLHTLKQQRRQQYAGTDSLAFKVQKVENMRDSMYQAILPPEKYLLYRQKKPVLLNNN